MKVKSGDFVMPGDVLGVSEQFLPDKWTYDDEGYIRASVLGTVDINSSKKKNFYSPFFRQSCCFECGR